VAGLGSGGKSLWTDTTISCAGDALNTVCSIGKQRSYAKPQMLPLLNLWLLLALHTSLLKVRPMRQQVLEQAA
jgi:hypothetical protein